MRQHNQLQSSLTLTECCIIIHLGICCLHVSASACFNPITSATHTGNAPNHFRASTVCRKSPARCQVCCEAQVPWWWLPHISPVLTLALGEVLPGSHRAELPSRRLLAKILQSHVSVPAIERTTPNIRGSFIITLPYSSCDPGILGWLVRYFLHLIGPGELVRDIWYNFWDVVKLVLCYNSPWSP